MRRLPERWESKAGSGESSRVSVWSHYSSEAFMPLTLGGELETAQDCVSLVKGEA